MRSVEILHNSMRVHGTRSRPREERWEARAVVVNVVGISENQ